MNKQYDETLCQSLIDCIEAGINDGCLITDRDNNDWETVCSKLIMIPDDTGNIPYIELKLQCVTNRKLANKYILLKVLRLESID